MFWKFCEKKTKISFAFCNSSIDEKSEKFQSLLDKGRGGHQHPSSNGNFLYRLIDCQCPDLMCDIKVEIFLQHNFQINPQLSYQPLILVPGLIHISVSAWSGIEAATRLLYWDCWNKFQLLVKYPANWFPGLTLSQVGLSPNRSRM